MISVVKPMARIELLDHGRVGEIAALLDGIGELRAPAVKVISLAWPVEVLIQEWRIPLGNAMKLSFVSTASTRPAWNATCPSMM